MPSILWRKLENECISSKQSFFFFNVFKFFAQWFLTISKSFDFFYQKTAAEVDIGKLSYIKKDLEKLLEIHPYLKTSGSDVNINTNENIGIDNGVEYIIPKMPPYFNIANLKATVEEKKIIHLDVPAQNIPTAIPEDRCAANLQGLVLLDEMYGIKSLLNFVLSMHQLVLLDVCAHHKQCAKAMQNLYINI